MSFSVPFHFKETDSSANTNFDVLTAVIMKLKRLPE
jgi:hypothetical protein